MRLAWVHAGISIRCLRMMTSMEHFWDTCAVKLIFYRPHVQRKRNMNPPTAGRSNGSLHKRASESTGSWNPLSTDQFFLALSTSILPGSFTASTLCLASLAIKRLARHSRLIPPIPLSIFVRRLHHFKVFNYDNCAMYRVSLA